MLILFCGVSSIASAQWAWRDDHGRTVYSDEPPPPTIRPTDVLHQPEIAPSSPAPDSNDATRNRKPKPPRRLLRPRQGPRRPRHLTLRPPPNASWSSANE